MVTRLSVDIDGVLDDFTEAFTLKAVTMGLIPKAWTTAEQPSWDFDKNLFDDELVWAAIKDSYNWWLTLRPLLSEEETELLNRVIRDHDVYFITTRPRTRGLSAEAQSRYWLESIGLQMGRPSVIATKGGTKGALAAGLNLTVAIDDNVGNLEDYAKEGILAVCRTWKYNKEWLGPRVNDLGTFLTEFVLS